MAVEFNQQGTRTDIGQDALMQMQRQQALNQKTPKQMCQEKGGYWDEKTQTCLMMKPAETKKTETIETTTTPNQNGIIRNEQGNVSGFTKDGKSFIGLPPKEVEGILAKQQFKQQGGQATQAFEQQALAQRQAMAQQSSLTEAQGAIQRGEPLVTEADILRAVPQEGALETGQAIGAGLVGGVAGGFGGAALGAKAGALLGTAIAPGVGTALGAGLGALVGLIGGAYTKIALDKRGDVKQALKVAKIANTNFGQTIDALNAGLISHDEALKRWNDDKVSLYAAYANLKRDTSTNLDRFLSGGADELAMTEDYIRDLQTIYTTEFMLAYSAPDPQKIRYLNQNLDLEA